MKKMNPVVHFEMPADDEKRMAGFYSRVFNWQLEMLGPEMNNYTLVNTTKTGENGMPDEPGAINGGFYTRTEGMPNKYPTIVISVEDIRESVRLVSEAGGTIIGSPDEIPGVGQFVYFKDTEGNIAGILQPVQTSEQ